MIKWHKISKLRATWPEERSRIWVAWDNGQVTPAFFDDGKVRGGFLDGSRPTHWALMELPLHPNSAVRL